VIGEKVDIIRTLTERSQMDVKTAEPKVEVFAKILVGEKFDEGLSRGGKNADVDRSGSHFSEGEDFAVFDRPEHFDLQSGRGFGDFVEEDRSALCLFEKSLTGRGGSGESSLGVAEKLGLDGLRVESTDGNGQEGMILAATVGMNGSSDEFLAGPSFSGDEDGDLGLGDEGNLFEDDLHGGRGTEERFFSDRSLIGRFQIINGTAGDERTSDDGGGFFEVKGLGEVIERTFGDRPNGDLQIAEGGDDDDGSVLGPSPDFAECGESVHSGESHIEDDCVELLTGCEFQGVFGGGSDLDVVSFFGEEFTKSPADGGFIVHDEESAHSSSILFVTVRSDSKSMSM